MRPEFVLGAYDFLRRTHIRRYLSFYRETLGWGPKQIKDHQLRRAVDLLDYAYRHVPFYRQRLEENGLSPDSFKSIEDLQRIPPLTRENVQERFEQLQSDEKAQMAFETSGSSGTTGIPIIYCQDRDAVSAGVAAGMFGWELSGWRFGVRSLHIWGNPTSIRHWNSFGSRIKRLLHNQKNIAATELNHPENYPGIVRMLRSYSPVSIDGYASAIFSLARYCLEREIDVPRARHVFTTAENLLPEHKQVIEEVLGPVSDGYGCGEINGIAVCPAGQDRYFIVEPHVIVEAVDSGSTEGRDILVTDLDNRVMPLIRYEVGDLIDGVSEAADDAPFKYRYFNKIVGRAADIVRLENGKVIQPLNLLGGTLFRRIGGIVKHRVIWNGRCLTFLFETESRFDLKGAHRLIGLELQEYGVPHRIEVVQKLLPGASGKFKYFEIVEP